MISQSELKNRLHYEPSTGVFTWLSPVNGAVKKGAKAGCLHKSGRVYIRLLGSTYYAHRLAFLYMTGDIPDLVDHINREPADNRWENLRSATHSQNCCNRKRASNSGIPGVNWHKKTKKWRVQLVFRGLYLHLGYYGDIELAALASSEARAKYHGEFAV